MEAVSFRQFPLGVKIAVGVALAANPHSAEAHGLYTDFLGYQGRNDERVRERTLSKELDPNHYRLDVPANYVEYGFRSFDSLEQNRQLLDERAPETRSPAVYWPQTT
jgi:hypothetical protein